MNGEAEPRESGFRLRFVRDPCTAFLATMEQKQNLRQVFQCPAKTSHPPWSLNS